MDPIHVYMDLSFKDLQSYGCTTSYSHCYVLLYMVGDALHGLMLCMARTISIKIYCLSILYN